MNDGGEQSFVAEHDGCQPAVGNALMLPQPPGGIAGLNVLGGCCYDVDLLGLCEALVDVGVAGVQLIGEITEVFTEEMAGFVLTNVVHVVFVEVPVEQGLALMMKEGEQLLLHA